MSVSPSRLKASKWQKSKSVLPTVLPYWLAQCPAHSRHVIRNFSMKKETRRKERRKGWWAAGKKLVGSSFL